MEQQLEMHPKECEFAAMPNVLVKPGAYYFLI